MSKFEQSYGFIPISLVYIIGSSIALGFFLTCLILLFFGIETIHPYYILMGIVGSVGLLGTAVLSIKDWRKWREENK